MPRPFACYADSARDIAEVVRETLKADGFPLPPTHWTRRLPHWARIVA